ncbi:MAG: rod shape-determining protein RodA [Acidobacteria bacterium]|nr:MAG: rod shape-determining protein RodA [Acidobacteriota bacterium]MCL4287134.1 rod shape-determining protein RodA [Thermoleophilia bacterium]GIK77153.1 MAG: rod shape-determining protein RodA [Actinomycetes bacterium]
MPTIARPQTFDERSAGIGARAGLLKLDPLTALAAVGLIACSIVALGFTTRNEIAGDPFYYTIRQSIYAVVGIALMFALARIDYSRFRELRVGLYSLLIALNLAVLAIGFGAGGARRWIELPFFQFQPSELGKLLLVLALAGFAIDRARRQTEWQRTARLLLLGFMPALIVFVQPSLGTALVYCAVTFAILFVSGTPWQHFAAMGGLAAAAIAIVLVAAPAVGQPVLQGYQLERLTSFLNPSDDPADSSYQTKQSLTAIGSGGKLGRGDDATQAQQGFLPENHNDFIFAATAERWGFAGAALVLSLYALLIWRALRITTLSKNLYGSLVGAGIAAMLLFQVFVNVGMNVGLMPVTGVPLPLMSYGGTSVLVTFMAVGLLQSIYVQSQLSSPGRLRTAQ